MNREDKNFPEQLRMWRKAKGLKKIEAAKIFGVTPEAICHWESGKAQPQDGDMFVICEKLNLDPHMFLKKKDKSFCRNAEKKAMRVGINSK